MLGGVGAVGLERCAQVSGLAVRGGVVRDVCSGDRRSIHEPGVEAVPEVGGLAAGHQRLGQVGDHVELAVPQRHVDVEVEPRLDPGHGGLQGGDALPARRTSPRTRPSCSRLGLLHGDDARRGTTCRIGLHLDRPTALYGCAREAGDGVGQFHTRSYRDGVLEAEGFPVADVAAYIGEPATVVWVDLCGPSKEQVDELAGQLGLHELAVEDALEPHQRPKLDRYATHLFLSCHAVRVDADAGILHTSEIDAFVNSRWLVTIRKDDGFSMDPVLQRWDQSPDLLVQGVSFLLYGLLDLVVDGYFEAIEAFDDYFDEISEAIFSERLLDPAQNQRWFQMRQALMRFHRLAVPMREAISSLMRREHSAVSDDLYPYYQDVYDHILRVSESTDALRELVSTIVETNLGLRDYRQNQIVKKVTSWAAIIAVPTLVTGYYGMNVPFPGSGETSGVLVSAALIVAMSGGLAVLFRRRDWL
jgi:magnesium transporter